MLRFLHALPRCEKPLVAAVQGVAVGIGTTMLLHCDHVVASTDARLSTPFVALGLVPEAGSSLLAPRLMGHARAFSLLVMGEPLTAADAKTAGIVNAVVPAAEVDVRALAAARAIAALPPQAVLAARRLLRGSAGRDRRPHRHRGGSLQGAARLARGAGRLRGVPGAQALILCFSVMPAQPGPAFGRPGCKLGAGIHDFNTNRKKVVDGRGQARP